MTTQKAGGFIRSNVLGLTAIFIALTGTAVAGQQSSGAGPGASASSVQKQIKKLKGRVAALEAKPTPTIPTTLPPSGGAGGALTGSYPNPQIGPGAVTAGKFFRSVTPRITNIGAVAAESCSAPVSLLLPGLDEGDQVVMTPPVGFSPFFTLTGVPDPANDQVDIQMCNHAPAGGAAIDPDGMGGTYPTLVIKP